MIEETKFKVGDQVKIINYGSLIWFNKNSEESQPKFPVIGENENTVYLDISPELVGNIGIVVKAHKTQGIDNYSLEGPNKSAWYDNDQLELIYRPDYALIQSTTKLR